MHELGGLDPLTIQVDSGKTGSIIALDDAVWIQARNQFEYVVLSQRLGHGII